jgi:hypothetical protein
MFGMLSKPGALLFLRLLIIFLISRGDVKIDASDWIIYKADLC